MTPKWKLFAAGWLLVLAGGALARLVQTGGGDVDVRDVRVDFVDGEQLSALLFVPPNATPETPAPGVLAVHGYINSRETQSGFAIELARRGFVVLALDQPGHGFSQGRSGDEGFGGPAGLRYLRGLPFVDTLNVGLEGHSMGGWSVLYAAADQPFSYRSVALVGSATGPGFAPPGSTSFPRNLGVIFSRWDEFAQLMWGVPEAADVTTSRKLRGVFGTEENVEPGRLYGEGPRGTARWLAIPNTTHPGDHLSTQAIGYTIHWLTETLDGDVEREIGDQVWPWKEIGTLVALLGAIMVMLGAFELLLSLPRFAPLAEPGVAAVERASPRWWAGLLVATAVPALTYFPVTALGSFLEATPPFPQEITNQILVWAVVSTLIALPVLLLKRGTPGRDVLARACLALAAVGCVYVASLLSRYAFLSDFRFWVVALKPMAAHHVPMFLAYVIPFTAFFYVTQLAAQRALYRRDVGAAGQYAIGVGATAGGFAVMVFGLYVALFATGRLPAIADVLFTVIAIQFVPILAITGLVSVFAWRRTNSAVAGAVMCGLLVTWYIVAGQATHV